MGTWGEDSVGGLGGTRGVRGEASMWRGGDIGGEDCIGVRLGGEAGVGGVWRCKGAWGA